LNQTISLFLVQARFRTWNVNLHQIDERRTALPARHRRGKINGLASCSLTQQVPPLVRANREQPGLESAAGVEAVRGDVNLEKRLLKDVLRGLSITHQSRQEANEVVVMTLDQRTKRRHVATPIIRQ